MNERAPHSSQEKYEVVSEHELNHSQEKQRKIHETAAEKAEKSQVEIEQIRANTEREAKSAEEMRQETSIGQTSQENEPRLINYELKEIAYQRLLKRARKHLPTYSRAMSKIIHQPVVDNISEAIGKTVGRPSGIIGGGLLALFGTSIYYYLARHYGYNYNPFVFILLMVVGFILGWSAEIIFKFLKTFSKK
jgi:translation elongation factor EF-G